MDLYPFHNANIHEQRPAARFFRAVPLGLVVACISAIVYASFRDELLLLALCAVMNVALWLWITTTSVFGMMGSWVVAEELKTRSQPRTPEKSPFSTPRNDADSDSVMHLIVFPNYKEEESMLADTLVCLSEAEDSHSFHVVLAMEAREGDAGEKKISTLQDKFSREFASFTATVHPADLNQDHLDDSVDLEVPGKASNLKWAVNQSYKTLRLQDSNRICNVILTVADADCMFHPDYFSAITKDFNELREKPEGQHQWSMWQAPQLSYRDHWHAPVCSRAWTYISSMYEFGGTSGLYWGGHHMVFSGYSMPLQLAMNVQCWDGDIIAEDHHAYLKTFFYSAHTSASQSLSQPGLWDDGCQPMLQVRPIFLPVKSTPVISSEGYWQNFVERWHQSKRHAQGVAELSYFLLALWDAMWTLPASTYSFCFFYKIGRILARLIFMHILPICQAVGLGVMTIYWLIYTRELPSCPNDLTIEDAFGGQYPLCALGGAWNLVWPMVVPFVCVICANYAMVSAAFLNPARSAKGKGIWYKEDSGIEPKCGSRSFGAFLLIAYDCTFFLSIMMIPYGLFACIYAMISVCFYGNRFTYITAAKAAKEKLTYGTMSEEVSSEVKEQP